MHNATRLIWLPLLAALAGCPAPEASETPTDVDTRNVHGLAPNASALSPGDLELGLPLERDAPSAVYSGPSVPLVEGQIDVTTGFNPAVSDPRILESAEALLNSAVFLAHSKTRPTSSSTPIPVGTGITRSFLAGVQTEDDADGDEFAAQTFANGGPNFYWFASTDVGAVLPSETDPPTPFVQEECPALFAFDLVDPSCRRVTPEAGSRLFADQLTGVTFNNKAGAYPTGSAFDLLVEGASTPIPYNLEGVFTLCADPYKDQIRTTFNEDRDAEMCGLVQPEILELALPGFGSGFGGGGGALGCTVVDDRPSLLCEDSDVPGPGGDPCPFTRPGFGCMDASWSWGHPAGKLVRTTGFNSSGDPARLGKLRNFQSVQLIEGPGTSLRLTDLCDPTRNTDSTVCPDGDDAGGTLFTNLLPGTEPYRAHVNTALNWVSDDAGQHYQYTRLGHTEADIHPQPDARLPLGSVLEIELAQIRGTLSMEGNSERLRQVRRATRDSDEGFVVDGAGNPNFNQMHLNGYPTVRATDTIGAGDGYVASYLEGTLIEGGGRVLPQTGEPADRYDAAYEMLVGAPNHLDGSGWDARAWNAELRLVFDRQAGEAHDSALILRRSSGHNPLVGPGSSADVDYDICFGELEVRFSGSPFSSPLLRLAPGTSSWAIRNPLPGEVLPADYDAHRAYEVSAVGLHGRMDRLSDGSPSPDEGRVIAALPAGKYQLQPQVTYGTSATRLPPLNDVIVECGQRIVTCADLSDAAIKFTGLTAETCGSVRVVGEVGLSGSSDEFSVSVDVDGVVIDICGPDAALPDCVDGQPIDVVVDAPDACRHEAQIIVIDGGGESCSAADEVLTEATATLAPLQGCFDGESLPGAIADALTIDSCEPSTHGHTFTQSGECESTIVEVTPSACGIDLDILTATVTFDDEAPTIALPESKCYGPGEDPTEDIVYDDNCALGDTSATVGPSPTQCSALVTASATDLCQNATVVDGEVQRETQPVTLEGGDLGCFDSVDAFEEAALDEARAQSDTDCGVLLTTGDPTVGQQCAASVTITAESLCDGASATASWAGVVDTDAPVIHNDDDDFAGCYAVDLDDPDAREAFEQMLFDRLDVTDSCADLRVDAELRGDRCDLSYAVTATDCAGHSTTRTFTNIIADGGPQISGLTGDELQGRCWTEAGARAEAEMLIATHTTGCDLGDPLASVTSPGCRGVISVTIDSACGSADFTFTDVVMDSEPPVIVEQEPIFIVEKPEADDGYLPTCADLVAIEAYKDMAKCRRHEPGPGDKPKGKFKDWACLTFEEVVTAEDNCSEPSLVFDECRAVKEVTWDDAGVRTVRKEEKDPEKKCRSYDSGSETRICMKRKYHTKVERKDGGEYVKLDKKHGEYEIYGTATDQCGNSSGSQLGRLVIPFKDKCKKGCP